MSEQTEDSIQAIALKPVDRIPLLYRSNFWFAKYSRIPIRPFFYEYDFVSEVTKKIAGNCTSRLKIIADIPKGKCIYWFESGDIFRAKQVMGNHVYLRGNVPASMLNGGTPDDVTEYSKKLIDVVGKNGGFMLDGAIGIPDEAKLENVKAMYAAVHRYGRYD